MLQVSLISLCQMDLCHRYTYVNHVWGRGSLTWIQAPVHTDSLTEYKSELKVTKTEDGDEIREQKTIATSVVEQRLSHFLMGLAILGTMTGPLLIVLHTIPRSLFAGVFFVVGVRKAPSELANISFRLAHKKLTPSPYPYSGAPSRPTASCRR